MADLLSCSYSRQDVASEIQNKDIAVKELHPYPLRV